MEGIRKRRTVLRSAFTRVANQLEKIVDGSDIDTTEVEALNTVLQQKMVALKVIDDEMFNTMIAEEASEDDLSLEMGTCDEYQIKFTHLQVRYVAICHRNEGQQLNNSGLSEACQSTPNWIADRRRFKLPQIELVKFSGDVREWLPFWSSFKKIHEATDLAPEDKFQYLLSTVIPKTRARALVESFPSTAENYDKVIDSLKSRFGREDLLVEVYVRELLKLVLNNAMTDQYKNGIPVLYDSIETQLRALETLGINTETCSAMLYPLVESCLPEEILRVWQRSSEFIDKLDATLKNRLERLMSFMKAEVEGEERISLAVEGFGLSQNKFKQKSVNQSVPTAAGLISQDVPKGCLFCESNHPTERCIKAQKFTFDEKKTILKGKRACFRCAKVGHVSRMCRNRLRCLMCGGQHLSLLCPELTVQTDNDSDKEVNSMSKTKSLSKSLTETGLANRTGGRVFLQTLVVKIRSQSGVKMVRAVIDTGSQRSYVLKDLALELKYPPKRVETLVHALFGGGKTSENQHVCYDVRLLSLDGKYACTFEALDQSIICNDIPSVYSGIWTRELQELNICISDTKGNQPIKVLIGADIAGKIFTGRKQVLPCGLIAMETLLGWVLMGKICEVNKSHNRSSMLVTNMLNTDVPIAALWELDVLGITDPGERNSKAELELAAKQLFEETVCVLQDRRYEVSLPWLEGQPPLPSNYSLASRRLVSTEKKLKMLNKWNSYDEVFSEWLEEGIIEEVPQKDKDKPAHYLPHRPVFKESSATTKIRPVFDASAREKGHPSLNDCLEKGMNILEQIPTLLIRFRKFKFGVTSDIRKAFLQISLTPSDREFLRFIWRNRNGDERIFRHKRVVFGVNASPFLLGATIEHHLKKCLEEFEKKITNYTKQTIEMLLNSFYVDNCVISVPNEESLEKFISEATEIMEEAKFELRGWEYSGKHGDDKEMMVSLLGLNWNKKTDTFSIKCNTEGEAMGVITKRIILSFVQRLFDPIGFICPATLSPKLLLQEMWEIKIGWDVEVNEKYKKPFYKWTSQLPFLYKIEVPRWISYEPKEVQNVSLHIFCDASKLAYAAVVFLRIEKQCNVEIHLIQAKSRIAPLKKLSIPRLELMAASIGARLGSQISKTLDLGDEMQIFYWSDSTTVLSWIRQSEEWAIFVGNRVHEIRSLTSIDSWRHVPGDDNPADLPSRGCFPKQLAESKWWEGPGWLYEDSNKWPQKELEYDRRDE